MEIDTRHGIHITEKAGSYHMTSENWQINLKVCILGTEYLTNFQIYLQINIYIFNTFRRDYKLPEAPEVIWKLVPLLPLEFYSR